MMSDNYFHCSDTVMYVEANIPGPTENTTDYIELYNNFNSQFLDCCNCKALCSYGSCECLKKSGDDNYTLYEQNGKYVLKLNSKGKVYPYIECNDKCSCTRNCGNRLAQNGPVGGLYVQPCSENKGLGLFTSCFLRKGTFICEYAGELITKSQAISRHKLNKLNNKMNYIFCLNEYSDGKVIQTFVDPSHFGNIGRYLNHSCDPNCQVIPVRWNSPVPKLAVFAIVDISPGTELTFNYGSHIKNVEQCEIVNGNIKCLCNAQNCNGYMPFDNYN